MKPLKQRPVSSGSRAAPLVYVTGTDTGVGKTLLTALLLRQLRQAAVPALAIKPVCSGGLGDARVLQRFQPNTLSLEEISPYRYRQSLAPGVAAVHEGEKARLSAVVQHVQRLRRRCACLLIEGCGGVLSPLGKEYNGLDIIRRLPGHVLVVAPNRLGTINHVLLTARALESVPTLSVKVVLMGLTHQIDLAARTNHAALSGRLCCDIASLPYLGEKPFKMGLLSKHSRILEKTLARLSPFDNFSPLVR